MIGLISALLVIVVTWMAVSELDDRLAGMSDDAVVLGLNGEEVRKSELQSQVMRRFAIALVVSIVYVIGLFGLASWSRFSPSPAMLVATGLFALFFLYGLVSRSMSGPRWVGTAVQGLLLAGGWNAVVSESRTVPQRRRRR